MKKLILSIGLMLATATAFGVIQTKVSPDKPWRLFLLGDAQNLNETTDHKEAFYENANGNFEADADDFSWQYRTWVNYNHVWVSGMGGAGSEYNNWQNDDWDWQNTHTGSAGGTSGNMAWNWSGWGAEMGIYNDGTTTTGFTNTLWIWDNIGNEHCDVSDPVNKTWDYDNLEYDDDGDRGSWHDTYTRRAQTVWHVQTGGKAIPQRQNLWQFSGSAWEILDKRAVPPFVNARTRAIPATQIAIGSMGNLGTNGIRYNLLPNGIEKDVTPKVAGKDFYTFSVEAQKYFSYFEVFVDQPYPGTTYYDPTSVTAGHAFWQFKTDAPADALQYIAASLTNFVNQSWGFYPHGADCGLPGQLQNDNSHPKNVKRVFYIGFNDLISGLQFTRGISNAPPEYCYAVWGYSCVGAATDAGRTVGITLPTWWNLLNWTPQNFGAAVVLKYPGPLDDETPR